MESTLSTHRFDGLRVTFEETPEYHGIFPSEQIALGFIAALAEESTRDRNDHLPAFSYTSLDFPRTTLHLLTASKNYIDGRKSWEERRGFVTYSGAFGELPLPESIISNATAVRLTSPRRHLFSRSSLLNVSSLFPPSNNEYRFDIDGNGDPITKRLCANSEASVTEAAFYAPRSPVWIYARGGPQNPLFQLKSISGVLKVIAMQLFIEGRYWELAWSVRWGRDRVVMEGCMSKRRPRATRICQGIPGGPEFSLGAGTSDRRSIDKSMGTA
ncbi:MAG: hypothetical protein Q9199_003662 [Rusavskia elegans]